MIHWHQNHLVWAHEAGRCCLPATLWPPQEAPWRRWEDSLEMLECNGLMGCDLPDHHNQGTHEVHSFQGNTPVQSIAGAPLGISLLPESGTFRSHLQEQAGL